MRIQLMMLAVAVLVAGCGPDPRVAKQQEQINDLSNRLVAAESTLVTLQKLAEIQQVEITNNTARITLTENDNDSLGLRLANIEGRVDQIQFMTNLWSRRH